MIGTSPSPTAAPRLSPSQRSYRDNPNGFLERLYARAESLSVEGYTAYPTETPHAFVVAQEGAKDAPPMGYLVFPLDATCSCPFYARQSQGEFLGEDRVVIPCKHLLGLPLLVRATCKRHAREGDIHSCCQLWQHWMRTQSKKRRERLELEKQEALRQLQERRKDRMNELNRRAGANPRG